MHIHMDSFWKKQEIFFYFTHYYTFFNFECQNLLLTQNVFLCIYSASCNCSNTQSRFNMNFIALILGMSELDFLLSLWSKINIGLEWIFLMKNKMFGLKKNAILLTARIFK